MTAKTKTARFRRLISHGYFAPELPPCFKSEDLARWRESIWTKISQVPTHNNRPLGIRKFTSEPAWFHFPRYGREDRRHGVINPVSYLAIAKTISDHFVQLRSESRKSGISSSPLIFDWSGQRALVRPSVDLRDDFRVELSARLDGFVEADIQSFFHSIYTHAIPWVIYGKNFAKNNRGPAHFGNVIDLYCRNSQDGQTIGLPVGPDTSRLLAEVVSSAIDASLKVKLGQRNPTASRYIDDYTIGIEGGASGERVISSLRRAVSEFELDLNPRKTSIRSTSERLATGWKQYVRASFTSGDSSADAFSEYFYRINIISERRPDINIEKFALRSRRRAFTTAEEWKRVQDHLFNSYRSNPTLIDFFVETHVQRHLTGRDVLPDRVSRFISGYIGTLIEQDRTGEVIWLIYLAIKLNLSLKLSEFPEICSVENAMVAILAAEGFRRGVINGEPDYTHWNRFIATDALRGGMWLFTYEACRTRCIPAATAGIVRADPFFAPLIDRNVAFLDLDSAPLSLAEFLRSRHRENRRTQAVRLDFNDDFEFEIEEFDEDFDADNNDWDNDPADY